RLNALPGLGGQLEQLPVRSDGELVSRGTEPVTDGEAVEDGRVGAGRRREVHARALHGFVEYDEGAEQIDEPTRREEAPGRDGAGHVRRRVFALDPDGRLREIFGPDDLRHAEGAGDAADRHDR